ncbi:helix-turn-helix transcriptional regulator [Streptomyces gobiensis]|uniref:helix-turn-helix transcriptional regulator n=1 Tax=Streptomyces gobiensis TaxID=2875706 RepID=UPI001E352D83|nr:helix-turn-helix transcriptional regulator [Streptomyces gobiensis]UGY94294.1 helix-turn-helix transcriptional regulator [Streptomyces gobiensis]
MPEPGETAEIRAALLELRRACGLPVAFGGLLDTHRQLRIDQLSGTVTDALRGLRVVAGSGLGGKCLALQRPVAVVDYRSSRSISHEYDAEVGAERLCAVLAVPLVVRRRVRGVLYGALREPLPFGDRVLTAAVAVARDAEQALAVRDEARQLASRVHGPPGWEEVRGAHAELRALAPRIDDPVLREELLAACGRLATAAAGSAGPAGAVSLAPRELDVLAWVAAGATNADAAERLGVSPETVKGYLRSAMRRLGVHTRLAAVVAARRAGLLP